MTCWGLCRYDVFDVDDTKQVALSELVMGLAQVLGGSQEEKAHFYFCLYDDGRGNLEKQKVRTTALPWVALLLAIVSDLERSL